MISCFHGARMSDEPPPLRLKPRLKADTAPGGAPANSSPPMAPESAPPPAAEETPKIRLRPKLSAPTPAPEPAAEPVAEPVAEEAVPPPPEELESPPPAPPVDPTAGGEFPKFKLKFKPGGGSAAPMEQAPAPLPEEIPPPGE